MVKLLSTILLVLTILLFPPATLAVISQNAVPGDKTYPIKRGLEQGILTVASLTPYTKAMFSVNQSQTRFKEAQVLIASGKTGAGKTLEELVEQTAIAAQQIQTIQDPTQKAELKMQLIQSIQSYNQNLSQIQQQMQPRQPVPAPTIAPTTVPSAQPQSTTKPIPTPTAIAAATPRPAATPATYYQLPDNGSVTSGQLGNVQDQLGQIEDNLKKNNPVFVPIPGTKQDMKTPTPTATPTPVPTVKPRTFVPIPANKDDQKKDNKDNKENN